MQIKEQWVSEDMSFSSCHFPSCSSCVDNGRGGTSIGDDVDPSPKRRECGGSRQHTHWHAMNEKALTSHEGFEANAPKAPNPVSSKDSSSLPSDSEPVSVPLPEYSSDDDIFLVDQYI